MRFSKSICVKYNVKLNSKGENVETPSIKNTLTPEFKHSNVVQISKMKKKHLEFFESKSICFYIYGIQEDTLPDARLLKLTTRVSRYTSFGSILSCRLIVLQILYLYSYTYKCLCCIST